LPMWVADMDFRAPPVVLEALRAQVEHGIYGYPAASDEGARSAVAGWLERRHGWRVPVEWIVLAPGVVSSLYAALEAFTQPGDEILVQTPVYHPFLDIARARGRKLSENKLVEVDGIWRMDLDDFAEKAETAEIFVLCSPHNPVGRSWSRAELEAVAEICARTGTMLLVDEIHADLVFSPRGHHPFASLERLAPDRIATFVAPSKTFNLAGLNLSAVVIPDEIHRRAFLAEYRNRGISRTNAPGLVAMEAAYDHGEPWLDALMELLAENASRMAQVAHDRWSGVAVHPPEATYLAWLDCRGLGLSESELVRFFNQEARVGLNRGGMFGTPGKGWMRLNFGTPRAILDVGLERISTALEAFAKR